MTTKRLGIGLAVGVAALLMAMLFLPTSAASSHNFGTLVNNGDGDFAPSLTDPGDVELCRIDFGKTDTITDDAFYLDTNANNDVDRNDIFIGGGPGYDGTLSPGDLVTSGSVDDTTAVDGGGCVDGDLNWVDQDSDGKFRADDWLYIGVDDGDNAIEGATDTGPEWWIRLTGTTNSGEGPGTLVLAGNQDLQDFGAGTNIGATETTSEFGFFDQDNSGDFNQGDWAYFARGLVATGDLVPFLAARLVHEDMAFGSLTQLGDDDYRPTLMNPAVEACRRDFGDANVLIDDVFYIDAAGGGSVDTHDVRIGFGGSASSEYVDKGVGSFIASGDTAENAAAGDECAGTADSHLAYIDVDNSGDFGPDDWLYFGDDGDADGLIDPPCDVTLASCAADEWWIRLTDTDDYAAGSLVLSGNSDISQYGNGVVIGDTTAAEAGFFDHDNNAAWNSGDWLYLNRGAIAAGDTPEYLAARITHESEPFGSLVEVGDADFLPTLSTPGTAGFTTDGTSDLVNPGICRKDFGSSNNLQDDTFYLNTDTAGGAEDTIERGDIRLSAYNDMEPGTLVGVGDTQEIGAAICESAADTFLVFIDVDSDGDFGPEDWLYIGFDNDAVGSIEGSAVGGEFWVRLTDTDGGPQGTVVLNGDDDIAGFGAGTQVGTMDGSTGAHTELSVFDIDNSADLSDMDWLYIQQAGIVDTGAAFNGYLAVRLSAGDVIGTGGGGPTTSPTTSGTTSGSNQTSGSTSGDTSGSTSGGTSGGSDTSDTGGETTKKTPGLGTVAMVAVVSAAVAVVAWRRK